MNKNVFSHCFFSYSLLLILSSLCQPAFAQDETVPIYSPQEAVDILKGNKRPSKPFYIINFQGDHQEPKTHKQQNESVNENNQRSNGKIPVSLSNGQLLSGDQAHSTATVIFISRINYERGQGNDTNIELLSLLYGLSEKNARLLSDFAQVTMEDYNKLLKSERIRACNTYELEKMSNSEEKAVQVFSKYFDKTDKLSNEYWLSIYKEMQRAFSGELYTTVMNRINSKKVYGSDFDFYQQLIFYNEDPAHYFDSYCQSVMN